MKIIEFKMRDGVPPDEELAMGQIAIVHKDGSRVRAGELEVGRIYAVQEDGLMIENMNRKQRRAQSARPRSRRH